VSRHCARRERPRRRRAAEERDELAPFQLIELHSVPVRQGRIEDIELARISQEVTETIYDGPTVFAHACKMGLEGIVSKRRDSAYRSGRSPIGRPKPRAAA